MLKGKLSGITPDGKFDFDYWVNPTIRDDAVYIDWIRGSLAYLVQKGLISEEESDELDGLAKQIWSKLSKIRARESRKCKEAKEEKI